VERAASAGVRLAGVLLLCLVVLVLVVLPWTIRSSVELERPVVLSTNVGSLVEAANCPSTYHGSLLGMWDRDCLHETKRRGSSEAEPRRPASGAGSRRCATSPNASRSSSRRACYAASASGTR
jgi:hypothetical protein